MIPTTKVTAAGIAACVATIAVWALKTYAHTDLPAEVVASGTGLFTVLVAYFVPSTSAKDV